MSPKLWPTGILGERPYTYSEKKTRYFSEQSVVRLYELITPDAFEEGDAYSLHATQKAAEKFKPHKWWQWAGGPKTVYVSSPVFEEINKKRGKSVFVG
jgi:hypothetical protein